MLLFCREGRGEREREREREIEREREREREREKERERESDGIKRRQRESLGGGGNIRKTLTQNLHYTVLPSWSLCLKDQPQIEGPAQALAVEEYKMHGVIF